MMSHESAVTIMVFFVGLSAFLLYCTAWLALSVWANRKMGWDEVLVYYGGSFGIPAFVTFIWAAISLVFGK